MKTIIHLIMISVLMSGTIPMIFGQDGRASRADIREQREYEKQMRREKMGKEQESAIKITRRMVEIHRFVLEANHLSDKYGNRVIVSPSINFIMVDSLDAIVQFGSAYSIGYNGVGGQTLEGEVAHYEYAMTGRKKDSYSIKMIFRSVAGTYDIFLLVSPAGSADATIRGNWPGELNYHGNLIPLGLSRIYKGHGWY